ncbi:MAG: universal stress protein [Gemmatimonadetes bacterium]|nr:universal stress protein [Gemmatimonadota bacterium]NNM03577.1 universal stress protein [Gemmatimonadota bacterium]
MSRTILVASDGTPAASGALAFAQALAREREFGIRVLGVVEPVPVFDAGFMVALPEMELYESRREALREEIQGQVDSLGSDAAAWPVSVRAGVPGTQIVKFAEEIGAATIVLGLGRHGPMDRVFGTETALQVLRVSHIPVLAVPESFTNLPSSAVMGVDFSLFSQRAARAAIGLLASPWDVHLVHVLSGMEFLPTLSEEWRGDYEDELLDRLSDFAGGLNPPPGCETHFHVLEGEPSHEILGFAAEREVDLLVAGSHGHSFVGRILVGSVSTRILRSSTVPVLVVPPVEPSEDVLTETAPESEAKPWVKELNDFTKANVGRRTTLELEDPELGFQESGRNFPLWGVDYDPKKDRIDIMLGRSGTVEGHLTHSLPGPREVTIMRGEDGRAESLNIIFRTGKAVLRIHRD